MTYFKLDWLQPGMVLEQAVLDDKGVTLLAAGTELTAKHLSVLRTRGIGGAEIVTPEGEVVTEPAVDDSATLEQAQARFRHVDTSHPLIAELWRLYQNLYLRKE